MYGPRLAWVFLLGYPSHFYSCTRAKRFGRRRASPSLEIAIVARKRALNLTRDAIRFQQQKSGRRAILPPSTPPLIESSPPESLGCIREKEGKDEDSFEYAKAQIFLKDETQRHLLVEGRTRRFPVSLPSDLDRSMEAVELITTLASTPRDRSCSPRPLQCSVCADDMMEFIKGVYKELVGLGEALDGAEDPVAQVRATLEEAEISFGQLEQLLATMRAAKADLEKVFRLHSCSHPAHLLSFHVLQRRPACISPQELNQRLGRILYLEEKLEKERTRRASLVSSMQTEVRQTHFWLPCCFSSLLRLVAAHVQLAGQCHIKETATGSGRDNFLYAVLLCMPSAPPLRLTPRCDTDLRCL